MKVKCNYTSVRSVYKDVDHRMNHTEFKLCNDIEKNPGPIDHTRTIQAPYSQGNVEVFGENAGTQCVAIGAVTLDLLPMGNLGVTAWVGFTLGYDRLPMCGYTLVNYPRGR